MSKPITPVNRNLLVAAITKAEENGPLANLGDMARSVCEEYNKLSPKKTITFSIVTLRIKEWKLTTKTKAGRKGRLAGGVLSPEHKAAMQAGRRTGGKRADRFKSPEAQKIFADLRKITPSRFLPIVDAMERGSRAASSKLKCLECSSFSTSEVRNCQVKLCPAWLFRSYQGALAPEETGGIAEVETEETQEKEE